MKKTILIFSISFIFLFLFMQPVVAIRCDTLHPGPPVPNPTPPPPTIPGPQISHPDTANSLVPCGQYLDCRCDIVDLFEMGLRIYKFILWYIATPLAVLMTAAGGILILLSGGPGGKNPVTGAVSPNLYNKGKDMVMWSFISILLMFSAWILVDMVFKAIGYTGNWSAPINIP